MKPKQLIVHVQPPLPLGKREAHHSNII